MSIPVPPKLEDEVIELPDEEPPMYFVDPQQLMDIFAALEEQNLFLIQNSQETEHTLEELNQQFKETRITMDGQTGQLQYQIAELQAQISNENSKAKALKMKRLNATVENATAGTVTGMNSVVFATSSAQYGCFVVSFMQVQKRVPVLQRRHRKRNYWVTCTPKCPRSMKNVVLMPLRSHQHFSCCPNWRANWKFC